MNKCKNCGIDESMHDRYWKDGTNYPCKQFTPSETPGLDRARRVGLLPEKGCGKVFGMTLKKTLICGVYGLCPSCSPHSPK